MRARIPKQQIELLGAVPLFSSCSHSELRSVAQLGTPITIEKGEVLIAKDTAGREFFLVLSGVASCRIGRRSDVSIRPAAASRVPSALIPLIRTLSR